MHTHTCTDARSHTYACTYPQTRIHSHRNASTHTRIYMQRCTHTHSHVHTNSVSRKHAHKHLHANTHTCKYTQMHIYMDVWTNDPLRIPQRSLGLRDPCQMHYTDDLCKQFKSTKLKDSTLCYATFRGDTYKLTAYKLESTKHVFTLSHSMMSSETGVHPRLRRGRRLFMNSL